MKYLPMFQMTMATIMGVLQTISVLEHKITSHEYVMFVMVFICLGFLFNIYTKVNKS